MMRISEQKRRWWNSQIKRLTEKDGLSKADIARRLGILPQALNMIESGKRGLSDKFLDDFIDTFGINQFDLFITEESQRQQVTFYESLLEQKDRVIQQKDTMIDLLMQRIYELTGKRDAVKAG